MAARDVVVIGAGPAGLATSRELTVRGIQHIVLERGPTIAHTWETLYDGLVLHTGKLFSALPGMPFPKSTPVFPTRRDFLDYLARYSDAFQVPVTTSSKVTAIARAGNEWRVNIAGGAAWNAGAVVVATGIVSNPLVPAFPGQTHFGGAVMHSVEYRRPQPYRGERVLVVGAGNSAGEIAVELAQAGAHVTISVRSGVRVVPRELLGVPIQYFGVAIGGLPKAVQRAINRVSSSMAARSRPPILPRGPIGQCSAVPLIGFHLVDAIREGKVRLKPALGDFTRTGVRFIDGTEEPFERVLLATGYRAALEFLGDQVRTDACGFALRRDRVISIDQPNLFFVGHNYDTRGGLRNIHHDAQLTARRIAEG